MRARRAKTSDAPAIGRLIEHCAAQGILLPRSESEVLRKIGSFLVVEEAGRVAGCVSLEGYGADLAEIRSLAVEPEIRGRGAGARLLECALKEAKARDLARVFAVTHIPEFFLRQGFEAVARQSIPEKMERDCRTCGLRRSCRLTAVIKTLLPHRATFSVLDEPAILVSAR